MNHARSAAQMKSRTLIPCLRVSKRSAIFFMVKPFRIVLSVESFRIIAVFRSTPFMYHDRSKGEKDGQTTNIFLAALIFLRSAFLAASERPFGSAFDRSERHLLLFGNLLVGQPFLVMQLENAQLLFGHRVFRLFPDMF